MSLGPVLGDIRNVRLVLTRDKTSLNSLWNPPHAQFRQGCHSWVERHKTRTQDKSFDWPGQNSSPHYVVYRSWIHLPTPWRPMTNAKWSPFVCFLSVITLSTTFGVWWLSGEKEPSNQALAFLISRVWVRVLVMPLVSLSKTLLQ